MANEDYQRGYEAALTEIHVAWTLPNIRVSALPVELVIRFER